jgi:hypothetical protein
LAPRVAAARSGLDADRARRTVAVAVALVHGRTVHAAQVHALLVAAHGTGAGTEDLASAPAETARTPLVANGPLARAALVSPPGLYRPRLIDTNAPAEQGGHGTPASSLSA